MAHIDVNAVYENTTMKAYYNNSNVLTAYRIYPNEGYVLHDNSYDQPVFDEETGEETGEIMLGYIPYPAFVTVGYNYDFTANPRQLYCVPADTVPENQIFNNGNDHEVMNVVTDTETN
jgi:hypothetical protein